MVDAVGSGLDRDDRGPKRGAATNGGAGKAGMSWLVLSSAPLSEEYRTRLLENFDEHLVFTHLAEIRRQSPLAALKRLRAAATQTCYLAIEDDSSRAVLPILQAIGSATWPRRMRLINADLSTSGLSSARFPFAVAATLSATP